MCDFCRERQRLTKIALKNPQPCFVCGSPQIVGVGTWIPDEKHRLAAGGTNNTEPVFAYCLCETHAELSEVNEKLITQTILRRMREGKGFQV